MFIQPPTKRASGKSRDQISESGSAVGPSRVAPSSASSFHSTGHPGTRALDTPIEHTRLAPTPAYGPSQGQAPLQPFTQMTPNPADDLHQATLPMPPRTSSPYLPMYGQSSISSFMSSQNPVATAPSFHPVQVSPPMSLATQIGPRTMHDQIQTAGPDKAAQGMLTPARTIWPAADDSHVSTARSMDACFPNDDIARRVRHLTKETEWKSRELHSVQNQVMALRLLAEEHWREITRLKEENERLIKHFELGTSPFDAGANPSDCQQDGFNGYQGTETMPQDFNPPFL